PTRTPAPPRENGGRAAPRPRRETILPTATVVATPVVRAAFVATAADPASEQAAERVSEPSRPADQGLTVPRERCLRGRVLLGGEDGGDGDGDPLRLCALAPAVGPHVVAVGGHRARGAGGR